VNAWLLPWLVRRATRRLGMHRPILWSFVPQAEVLLDALQPSQVLYYNDDDHAAKKGIDAPSFAAAEERFARRADVILASAPELAQRMRSLNDHVVDAPNVADTELFATALERGPQAPPVDPALAALPGPRIVFTGAIVANKLDLALIGELASARPDWSFAFVGPIGPGDPSTDVSVLRTIPNVHLLGPRRYEELPAVLRGADVGILPYLTEGEMRSVFPMKTYEYLAAGLPIVSTRLPALEGVPDIVRADTGAEMADRIAEQIAADDPAARDARSLRAQAHSFDARVAQIGEALSRA
jgi:glycosyltransferase involved in cell wall biosynthesis